MRKSVWNDKEVINKMAYKKALNEEIQKKLRAKASKPKRLQIGERVFAIIKEEIENVVVNAHPGLDVVSVISGQATIRILKIVQNNYRRRIY